MSQIPSNRRFYVFGAAKLFQTKLFHIHGLVVTVEVVEIVAVVIVVVVVVVVVKINMFVSLLTYVSVTHSHTVI